MFDSVFETKNGKKDTITKGGYNRYFHFTQHNNGTRYL